MKEYASNPRAAFDFEIIETLEAGVVLTGNEVKAIKTGKATLRGTYVRLIHERPFLVGATITPYQPANTPPTYNAQADRALLMSKKQIATLSGIGKAEGLTLVPLKLYDKGGRIKLLVGIARGKRKYDKRETIKKKDLTRSRARGGEE